MSQQKTAGVIKRGIMLCLVLFVVQILGIAAYTHTQMLQEYHRQFQGFQALNTAEFYSLISSHTESPVQLNIERSPMGDERAIRFSLTEESSVYLSASADSAPTVFVHPLVVKLESGRQYLLPLIRSSEPGRRVPSTINLGRFAAGEHVVSLSQNEAVTLPIPDSLQLAASKPSPDSLLASFIDHSPVVKIKDLNNILDDIPLVGFSDLSRSGSRYMVTSQLIFSSENGGLIPPRLMNSYQRTVDVEWVMKQIFETDGDVVASHQLFQSKGHGVEQFAGEVMFGNSPVLNTATPNNNFADGQMRLWHWKVPNVFTEDNSNPVYYRPKPIFLPPNQWSQDVLADMPELQEWSQYEIAFEHCVNLDDGSSPITPAFMEDLRFIREHLRVSYPDRGCQDHKLVIGNLWVAYPIQRLGDS